MEARRKKGRKKKKSSRTEALVGRVEQYGVPTGIAQANAGNSTERLVRDDAKDAVVTARNLSENRSVNSGMNVIKEERSHQSSQSVGALTRCEKSKKMKLAEMLVFGSPVMTLLHSGAVPGVMSLRLCHCPQVVPMQRKRRVAMVDSREAVVAGEVSRVPVTTGQSTAEISCLVLRSSRQELIIGRPKMKKCGPH